MPKRNAGDNEAVRSFERERRHQLRSCVFPHLGWKPVDAFFYCVCVFCFVACLMLFPSHGEARSDLHAHVAGFAQAAGEAVVGGGALFDKGKYAFRRSYNWPQMWYPEGVEGGRGSCVTVVRKQFIRESLFRQVRQKYTTIT